MKIALVLSALLLAGGLTVNAQKAEKAKVDPEASFKKMDANSDGKLTKAEFMASPGAKKDEAKAATRWTNLSKGKEEITLDEFKAASTGKKKKAA